MNKFKMWIQRRSAIIQAVIKAFVVALIISFGVSFSQTDILWVNLIGFMILAIPISDWIDSKFKV